VSKAFEDYIVWREQHPSDDVMTELLNAEYEDVDGQRRKLTRTELLNYVNLLAAAGNETTTRLIGWMGTVLADHPDQRRQVVDDRGLVADTVEEVLRYEPPAPHVGRYVARDAEFQGETVPEGSAILFLVGAANRDERRFEHGDTFDIHRPSMSHLSFGYGAHFCLGAALARLEGRVALDELLTRFPEWDVVRGQARISPTSTVRGWETLPIVLP
jgi:cytochrome P450